MIKSSECTIVIPHLGATKEQEYALDQCLLSLQETAPQGMRIIVAHNGRNNCQHYGLADINIREQGQCKAVNAAIAMTDTPWIFITNDDMIYAPGWWERLLGLGDVPLCISPMLIEPRKGAPTFEVYFAGGAGGDFNKEKWLQFVRNHNDTPHVEKLRTGFNFPFLIKRELWDTVGGYDINYDPWGSNGDSDLQYKIMLAGIQPYQNTNCIVYHFSQTSGTFEPRNNHFYQQNFEYFENKWGFKRTDEGIWEANFQIPTIGRLFNPEWEGKYAK